MNTEEKKEPESWGLAHDRYKAAYKELMAEADRRNAFRKRMHNCIRELINRKQAVFEKIYNALITAIPRVKQPKAPIMSDLLRMVFWVFTSYMPDNPQDELLKSLKKMNDYLIDDIIGQRSDNTDIHQLNEYICAYSKQPKLFGVRLSEDRQKMILKWILTQLARELGFNLDKLLPENQQQRQLLPFLLQPNQPKKAESATTQVEAQPAVIESVADVSAVDKESTADDLSAPVEIQLSVESSQNHLKDIHVIVTTTDTSTCVGAAQEDSAISYIPINSNKETETTAPSVEEKQEKPICFSDSPPQESNKQTTSPSP